MKPAKPPSWSERRAARERAAVHQHRCADPGRERRQHQHQRARPHRAGLLRLEPDAVGDATEPERGGDGERARLRAGAQQQPPDQRQRERERELDRQRPRRRVEHAGGARRNPVVEQSEVGDRLARRRRLGAAAGAREHRPGREAGDPEQRHDPDEALGDRRPRGGRVGAVERRQLTGALRSRRSGRRTAAPPSAAAPRPTLAGGRSACRRRSTRAARRCRPPRGRGSPRSLAGVPAPRDV